MNVDTVILCFSCSSIVCCCSSWSFHIAIVRIGLVKAVKIHSHTNLKLGSSSLQQSANNLAKLHDDNLSNFNSSKKKKKSSSGGTGSGSLNAGGALNLGQEKTTSSSNNMYPGRGVPQVGDERTPTALLECSFLSRLGSVSGGLQYYGELRSIEKRI